MKWLVLIGILLQAGLSAQNAIPRRSDGDLMTGTWRCIKCLDSTVLTISFIDTMCICTKTSAEGIQKTVCPYRVKRNKVIVTPQDSRRRKYRIVLIDYNSLELKRWNKPSEEFRKSF